MRYASLVFAALLLVAAMPAAAEEQTCSRSASMLPIVDIDGGDAATIVVEQTTTSFADENCAALNGVVSLEVTTNRQGEVKDVSVAYAPEEVSAVLARNVVAEMKKWRFKRQNASEELKLAITFRFQ